MRISLIQANLTWRDPGANRRHMESLLPSPGETDLVVLPEMFSTGFDTNPESGDDGKSLGWMRDIARKNDYAITGSIALRTEEGWRNRMYFVRPDGTADFYDKRHLFSFSGEDRRFVPGERHVEVGWKGWRILLQVCYDLRFPVFSRNHAENPYDLAIYVASWPAARSDAWKALLRARAIENQCYAAGVNRVGEDPAGRYDGDSVILDYLGAPLQACTPGKEDVVTSGLDRIGLSSYREHFPALFDADKL